MQKDFTLYIQNSWEWFRQKSQTKAAQVWLGLYSFFESVILPFPTDVFLALMVLAHRARVIRFVVITTVSGVLGAVFLYVATTLFYTAILEPLVISLGWQSAIMHASETIQDYTFLATFIGAFSPIPYTPVIIAAGLLRADFISFLFASIVGGGLRYVIVSTLVYFLGEPILRVLSRYVALITLGVVIAFTAVVFFVVNL